MDREQTGANAEFVRAEFEKTARELDAAFVERARKVADRLDARSSTTSSVPSRARDQGAREALRRRVRRPPCSTCVRAVLGEVTTQMREDLRKQFSADNDPNPLAVFQRVHLAQAHQIAGQQSAQMRAG